MIASEKLNIYDLWIEIIKLGKMTFIHFALIPLPILVAILVRNQIAGTMVGIAGGFTAVILLIFGAPLKFAVWNPYYIPMMIQPDGSIPVEYLTQVWIVLIVTFLLGLLGGLFLYTTKDVK